MRDVWPAEAGRLHIVLIAQGKVVMVDSAQGSHAVQLLLSQRFPFAVSLSGEL